MAAGVRRFSFFESKHTTGLGCRGTGFANELFKERGPAHNRLPLPAFRETQLPHVSSALFDIDLGEGEEDFITPEEKSSVVQQLETLLLPTTQLEKQVSNDVQFLMLRHCHRPEESLDHTILASDLQSLGYVVNVRRSVGGGTGSEGMNNLNHSFLRCIPPGSTTVFIVDPKFRDQFEIVHQTHAYRQVLECIPTLIVIAEENIAPVVELLCEEMANSFKSSDAPLPPWRRCHSLLSKWQPRRSMDVAVRGPQTNEEVFGRSMPLHSPIKIERQQQKPMRMYI